MPGLYNACMNLSKRPVLLILLVSVIFLALGLATNLLLDTRQHPRRADIQGLMWPQPKVLRDFRLQDTHGRPFTPASLKDHWSFLFFGYTHCPDVCPTTMALLAQVDRLLQQDDGPDNRQFVFVSVDPERDGPKTLQDYVSYFNPAFIGATADEEQLSVLTRQLGILHLKVPQADGKDYLVDHSTAILLVDPELRVVGIFSSPHEARDIASRFQRMRRFIDAQG